MKKASLALLVALQLFSPKSHAGEPPTRPKLVVGIVVDQMRYDFLYRYWDYYGKGGIKKLVQNGYSFEQAHYPYAPTTTGAGHASIYTGTTPAYHGIADNDWLVRSANRKIYCVRDSTVHGLGTDGEAGKMSPRNMLVTNIGDELKYATAGRSKVISISIKDRGAIPPGGFSADAAYWLESQTGNWVSSSYYMPALPAWVQQFNQAHTVNQYVQQPWKPLLSSAAYLRAAGPDSSEYEGEVAPGSGTRMPVDMPRYFKGDYSIVPNSGHGIHATTDFIKAALVSEQLGKREGETDMLCISYSSTDDVGHDFGPDSWEVMDTYLRLDRDLTSLLETLDKQVGLKNVLVFLSADHGVAPTPGLAGDKKLPAGRFSMKEAVEAVKARLADRYGEGGWVQASQREQIYLNRALMKENKISVDEASALAAEALRGLPWVQNAWGGWALRAAAVVDPYARRLALGCHPERSGDVFLQPKSGYVGLRAAKGTAHSAGYAYDTHVPMLFWGWHVPAGQSLEAVEITDIAPTICAMMKIQMPSATIGKARPFTK